MLQTIHDKLKGWVAGVVLGAIALVFVFWGINWTLSAPTYAAKVNGTEISPNEVRQTYQQQLAQIERQGNIPLDDAMRNEIKQRVLEQYVASEALVTRADDLGYRVSDSELLAEMAKVPALQGEGGKFDYPMPWRCSMRKAVHRPKSKNCSGATPSCGNLTAHSVPRALRRRPK